MVECIDLEKMIGEEILEICEHKLNAMADNFTLHRKIFNKFRKNFSQMSACFACIRSDERLKDEVGDIMRLTKME